MNQEVMIPKMTREDAKRRKVYIPWANILLVLFGVLLMIMSTFVNLEIKHYILPLNIFSNKNLTSDDFICFFNLIPQIPIVMFVCSVLGKRLALTAVFLYIIIGIFFAPVFALGGGVRYFFEYGFGYILAYIPAVVIAGSLFGKYTFLNIFKAILTGVLTIHVLGIVYMVFIALLRHSGSDFMAGWIASQSGLKIVYDLVISFILVWLGKYVHQSLKFILG